MQTVDELLGPEQTVVDLLGPGPEEQETTAREKIGVLGAVPHDALERAAQNFQSNEEFRRATGSPITATQGAPVDFDKPTVQLVPELSSGELGALRATSASDQRKAAALNEVARSVNSLTSPNNLALMAGTMGFGAVPSLGRAVALGFSAYMGKHAIEAAHALAQELRKPEADRDEQKVGALMAQGGLDTFLAAAGLHGGLKGEPATPAERAASRLDRQVRGAEMGDVEAAAARGGVPTVETLLGPEPSAPPEVQTPERLPKPEVPTTPAEFYQSGVEEIRAKGARTIRQIQELWPNAELSREEARVWREKAWPQTEETGTPPAAAENPAAQAGESVPAAPVPEEEPAVNQAAVQTPSASAEEVPTAEPGAVEPAPETEEDLQEQLAGELTHSMATGSAPPLRTTPPQAPPPPSRISPPSPLPLPSVNPIRARLSAVRIGLQSIFSPQNIDTGARVFSHILRENNAQAALDLVRADAHLGELRSYFDRTPVPKDWKYDPNQPLPHNYAVMDALERNRSALPPRLQDFARAFDDEFTKRVDEVRKIKPGALQNLIADYFPHLWEKPDAANTKAIMTEMAAKAPFHGSGAFMKERSVPIIADGLARGLRPLSDNPVDLLLAKMHQMDKFLMAAKTMQEAKATGLLKYHPLGQRIPEGRTVVNDPAFTVYAPPVLEVEEAFDAGVRRGLMDFINKMGFSHERVARLGVNEWGQYTTGRGEIKSRFGGPDFVIMHEIGHGLEERYGLSRYLLSNDPLRNEMAALAAERAKFGGTKQFKKYIQSPDEQVANAVHGYLYAPEEMARIAPNVQMVLRNIIRQHPELADLNNIKRGFALGSEKAALLLPGPVLAGHWTLPDGAATVLGNFLSPGLSKWAPFRSLRAASNIINAAQLGLSGFHVGFTSLDAVVSSVATGLGYLMRGDIGKAAKSFGFAPFAPVANYYVGKAVQTKMIDPAASHVSVGFPKIGLGANVRLSQSADLLTRQIADLAVKGGLRAETDPFWKTQVTRNMVRAWHEGGLVNYAKAGLQLPAAAVEQSMRPIAEYLVPRQKLGVFTQLALQEMDKAGWGAGREEVRAAMARAADATEDRMGQMTYDNLFYNKMVKDVALLGFRAYGWQLGKYRHLYGGAADGAALVKGLIENGMAAAQGKPAPARLDVTNRLLYPLALTMVAATVGGVVHRMFTGNNPETLQDYLFPRTGRLDRDGRAERLALPTYMKDLAADAKALESTVTERSLAPVGAQVAHRLNPYVAAVGDMLNNKDYYGVEIRHPDDPLSKQMAELTAFAGKQFTPFSVSGTMKLAEDKAPIAQLVLPFIGVVPAKKALLMSPAETLAADITRASMEVGGRTREQFDHSQALKMIVQDLKLNGEKGTERTKALAAGRLRPGDEQALTSMLNTTPLQYQVGKMEPQNAMRVWRLATAAERQQLGDIVARKVANSKVLDPARQSAFLQELVKAGLGGDKLPLK